MYNTLVSAMSGCWARHYRSFISVLIIDKEIDYSEK